MSTARSSKSKQHSQPHSYPLYQRSWFQTIGYAALLGSSAAAISGCQSTPSTAPQTTGALIDYSVTDMSINQAQSRAFNEHLQANQQQHEQLFTLPNSEAQAKTRLLTAIRQHLGTEHVSVSQAHYQAVPFIDADSIDAGATGLLRTIIETYAHSEMQDEDDSNYSSDDDYDYNLNDEKLSSARAEIEAAMDATDAARALEEYDADADVNKVIVAEEAYESIASDYDAEGYDEYGYDQDGYDRYGFDQYGYDEYGYDQYGSQDPYLEGDDDYDTGGALSGLSKLNPRDFFRKYEVMQAQKQAKTAAPADALPPMSTGMLGLLLDSIHRTPEQIKATNAYQYRYLTFNSVSQFKPEQKRIQSVYSYDYAAPTMSSSIQIPLALDFANSRLSLDPSAIMPVVALINPEQTPTPNEMTAHTVDFGLPESITSQLPSAVIYDAVITGIQGSMAEISPEYFSAVDIRDDTFAKQVGASSAVKVYFGSKQSGEMIGRMLKYISQSLSAYVDAHPDKYPDGALLKTAIDKIEVYNKGYQSADVGALLQLVEALAPISFNHTNYYYLNHSDRLIAKQQRTNIGSDLFGAKMAVLNQTRYDAQSYNNHALTPLLTQSFGPNAAPAIDGNAWLKQSKLNKERLEQARYARYDYNDAYDAVEDPYEYENDEYEVDDNN